MKIFYLDLLKILFDDEGSESDFSGVDNRNGSQC